MERKLRYSVRHAQEQLDIGNTKFWALVRDKKIAVHFDGPRCYVLASELERYVASCVQASSAEPTTKAVETAH
jgi:hypothetical protein